MLSPTSCVQLTATMDMLNDSRVLVVDGQRYIVCNRTAGAIVDVIAPEPVTVEAICDALRQRFTDADDQITHDVMATLTQLRQAGAIRMVAGG